MADQLTSVRFDADTLDTLRTLAEIHDTNVAEEIRTAVHRYITALAEDEAFRTAAAEALRQRQERIERLLSKTS
jgi:hypothetical protein